MAKTIGDALASVLANPDPGYAQLAERAATARADEMLSLPPDLRSEAIREVESVIHLCESPIEQVALYQLAGFNWGNQEHPARAKVIGKRGEIEHYPDRIHIIPQVEFPPFRVDFLIDAGGKKLFAVECDGEEFHRDKARDETRDRRLHVERGVIVFRITGSAIWRGGDVRWNAVQIAADNIRRRIYG